MNEEWEEKTRKGMRREKEVGILSRSKSEPSASIFMFCNYQIPSQKGCMGRKNTSETTKHPKYAVPCHMRLSLLHRAAVYEW